MQAPAYDELLAQLRAIDPGSSAGAEAKKLAYAIESVRGSRVAAPLAIAPGGAPDSAASAQLEALRLLHAECARLAAGLGPLPAEARAAQQGRLLACQRQAHLLEEQLGHADERQP